MLQLTHFLLPILAAAAIGPSADTSSGTVLGLSDERVNRFLGIPFAQSPPVRFGKPTAATPWSTPLNATALRPSCIQQFVDPPRARQFITSIFNNPAPPESEDCLYLNVWAPANATARPEGGWPVMFWIYGGDLQFGYGGLPEYDGSHLAGDRDVVVVTSNYRTNVFGFPNAPSLPNGEGNPGFLDQRAALEWTAKNIASFGGDPKKVTIFGQSAGGYSVKQLIATPPKPLSFRAAIIQSQAQSPKDGNAAWQKITKEVGCAEGVNQLTCMQKIPALQLKSVAERLILGFAPVEDDITNVHDITTAVKSGRAARIPVVLGTTSDEGSAFAIGFGFSAADALNSPLPKVDQATADSITNLEFTCPTKLISNLLVENNYPGVYRYYFNASVPAFAPFPGAGAFHGIEIMPIFGTYRRAGEEAAWKDASGIIQGGLAGFVHDPSSGPGWDSQTALLEGKRQEPVAIISIDGLRQRVGGLGAVEDACADLGSVIEAQGL